MVGQQEVLVFAGEAEFEVPQGAARGVKRPNAHEEHDDVGGNQAGDVLRVLEGLQGNDLQINHHFSLKLFKILILIQLWKIKMLTMDVKKIICIQIKGEKILVSDKKFLHLALRRPGNKQLIWFKYMELNCCH